VQKVINVNVVGTFNVIRLVSEAMAAGEPYTSSGERGMALHAGVGVLLHGLM
jgi:NAD(P)-dependent dehydrogenase (short-subunit alcohol dehydrogenase family)